MSKILDYVLQPQIVYTGENFLVRVKVRDDYKYKSYIISENMKYTTATGTTFTLTNAVSSNNASILDLAGNTTQNGTPTPTSPIEVNTVSSDSSVVVSGKNFLDIEKIKTQTWTNNVYRGTRLNDINSKGTWCFKAQLKEGKTAISGLYVAIAQTINPNVSTNARAIKDGVTQASTKTFTGENLYISFYPTSHTIEEITEVYDLWISKSDTTYEPYVGNSYRVDFGGKNLLKIVKDSTTINGVTFTQNEDGSISVRGTATANASFISTTVQPIEPNRRMKVSGCPSGGSTSTYRLGLRVRSDTTTNIVTVSSTGSGGSDGNVTAYSNAHYILGEIWVYSGQTVDLTFYPQVEYVNLSSDPATEYSPYVSNPIELCKIGSYVDKLKRAEGKQLFDKSTITSGYGLNSENGSLFESNIYCVSDYIKVSPNTSYIFSGNSTTNTKRVVGYNSSKTFTENFQASGSTVSFTTGNNTEYIRLQMNQTDTNTVMLNEGSTALPYEPYGTNWYIEKNIGKVVADNNLSGNGVTSTIVDLITPVVDLPANLTSSALADRVMCNMLPKTITDNNGMNGVTAVSRIRVRIARNLLPTTSTDAETYLEANKLLQGMTIYYGLEHPTYETITNENLINQLNAIQDITLQPTLCYIDWVGSESPTMSLQYPTNEELNANIITESGDLIRTEWRNIGGNINE